MKLARREKFAYGVGDFSINLVWATTASFLSLYYTDVALIGAATVGTILLVARVTDAIWDLFLGVMVDRTQTRWGQCRPYLMFAAPFLATLLVLAFSVPDVSMAAKIGYAVATYTVLMCLFSMIGIPYSAMPALMTDDARERTTLAAWRMFLAMTGSTLVGMTVFKGVELLGEGQASLGYTRTMGLLAVLMVLLMWFCVWHCKERVPPVHQPMAVRQDLRALLAGRAWVTLAAIGLFASISGAVVTGTSTYFVKYVIGDTDVMGPALAILGAGMLSGVVASVWLTARFCKRKTLMVCSALGSLVGCVLFFTPVDRLWLFGGIAFIGQVFNGIGAPIAWSMLADTADEAELRSGRRVVGLSASSLNFAAKLGFGVGGALLGFVLAHIGYQPNVAQTPEAIAGLKALACLVPAVSNLVNVALLAIYPLGQSELNQIREGLQAKRAMAA